MSKNVVRFSDQKLDFNINKEAHGVLPYLSDLLDDGT